MEGLTLNRAMGRPEENRVHGRKQAEVPPRLSAGGERKARLCHPYNLLPRLIFFLLFFFVKRVGFVSKYSIDSVL